MNRIRESIFGFLAICAAAWPVMLVAEDEVIIKAVTATYNHDRATTVFEGDVNLTSEDVRLVAGRVEVLKLKGGGNKITATGSPIEFKVNEPGEDPASGIANRAVVHYPTDRIDLSGDVTFKHDDVVIKTQYVTYNWATRELQIIQPDGESEAQSDSRTTISIQVQN